MIEWREGVDVGPSNFYTTKFKVISTNPENGVLQLQVEVPFSKRQKSSSTDRRRRQLRSFGTAVLVNAGSRKSVEKFVIVPSTIPPNLVSQLLRQRPQQRDENNGFENANFFQLQFLCNSSYYIATSLFPLLYSNRV